MFIFHEIIHETAVAGTCPRPNCPRPITRPRP